MLKSLYTPEIRNYINTRPWPSGLRSDIVDIYDENYQPLFLRFVLYRDNFNRFDGEDQLRIANSVKECMEKIRADGIPIFLQVAKGDGFDNARGSVD